MLTQVKVNSNIAVVSHILTDIKVGKPCRLMLESGQEIETGCVLGWLKNIKGEVYIKTEESMIGGGVMQNFIGKPGCDKMLMTTRKSMKNTLH